MDKDHVQQKVNDIAGRMKQHVSEWTGNPELAAGKLPAEPKDGLEMPGQGREDVSRQTDYKVKKPVDRLDNSKAPNLEVEPPGSRNPGGRNPGAENPGAERKENRDWAAYGDGSRRKAS